MQAISTATGSGAASIAREKGYGPGVQFAAGLVGGLAPGGVSASTAATTRGLVRGRSGAKVDQTIKDFGASGTVPTVGQATQGRFARGMEQTLSRIPGGAGTIASKAVG